MKATIFDLETSTTAYMRRKGSPFLADNRIVALGYKLPGGAITGEYYGRADIPNGRLLGLLGSADVLVGANIKFDILYMLRDPENTKAWREFVARGGLVWDVQLAQYLIDGQKPSSQMMSLNAMATLYGGNLKNDEVKALWEAGVATEDIPQDLLMDYLVGTEDAHGDIGNTELVYLAQLKVARDNDLMRIIMGNMGSLCASIEMEHNGLHIDMAAARADAAELSATIDANTARLSENLPADLPTDVDFKFGNRYHLSPLLFGGTIKYQKRMPILGDDGKPTFAKMTIKQDLLDDAGNPVLFKSGLNAGKVKTVNVTVDDLDKPKTRLETLEYRFNPMTTPRAEWASSTDGLYSVSADVIEQLGNRGIPFLKLLADTAKMRKDLSTYYEVEAAGIKKGMLTLVQEDGIIHHSINHTSTVTGRLSSNNPNMQNISKGEEDDNGVLTGSRIKRAFTSRFEGGSVLSSDFTNLEVYVQANVTGSVALLDDLRQGVDMHIMRVSQAEHISYEEAFAKCKTDPVWKKKRQQAKIFSFQRAYGAGVKLIAESTGMSTDEVKALIEAENERYPEMVAFYDDLAREIEAKKKLTDLRFAHPSNAQVLCRPHESLIQTPTGKRYYFTEYATPDFVLEKGKATGFKPTEVKNYIIQGDGAEVSKLGMWLAAMVIYQIPEFAGKVLLVNQVHDALYLDAHPDFVEEAGNVLHEVMVRTSEFYSAFYGLNHVIDIPAVTEAGPSQFETTTLTTRGTKYAGLVSNLVSKYKRGKK